jgi:hypothetical protein
MSITATAPQLTAAPPPRGAAAPLPSRETAVDGDGLDRGIGFIGLLWTSVGSLIGSGWLFGALIAVTVAGPSALIAWGIASVIVILLALVHAELGGLFPVSGGTSRFPHYAFGSLAGMTFGRRQPRDRLDREQNEHAHDLHQTEAPQTTRPRASPHSRWPTSGSSRDAIATRADGSPSPS